MGPTDEIHSHHHDVSHGASRLPQCAPNDREAIVELVIEGGRHGTCDGIIANGSGYKYKIVYTHGPRILRLLLERGIGGD